MNRADPWRRAPHSARLASHNQRRANHRKTEDEMNKVKGIQKLVP